MRRNADAVIADGDPHVSVATVQARPRPCVSSGEYFTALSSRFHTALRERLAVGLDLDAAPLPRNSTSYPAGCGLAAEVLHDAPHQLRAVARLEVIAVRAGFHAAEVEQRLDQPASAGRSRATARRRRSGGASSRSGCSRSISVNCRSDVSGVRNSCETAATKSDCSRATASSRLTARTIEVVCRERHAGQQDETGNEQSLTPREIASLDRRVQAGRDDGPRQSGVRGRPRRSASAGVERAEHPRAVGTAQTERTC